MLIDDYRVLVPDPMLVLLASMNGKTAAKHLQQGVYEIGHFGCTGFPGPDYKDWYADLDDVRTETINWYGVCDSVEQLLAKYPELEASERQFLVTVHPLKKSEQSPDGGWRWHKWGEYIGTQEPLREYLYDEPVIEEVMVYQIYERNT